MVAYSFNKRFVPAIASGVKQQTIRAPRKGVHRHAMRGDEIQLYTGLRTKHTRLIGRAKCLSTRRVCLHLRDGAVFFPHECDALVPGDELEKFAREDGFSTWAELVAFWARTHPGCDIFDGVQIRWGDTFAPATIAQAV